MLMLRNINAEPKKKRTRKLNVPKMGIINTYHVTTLIPKLGFNTVERTEK